MHCQIGICTLYNLQEPLQCNTGSDTILQVQKLQLNIGIILYTAQEYITDVVSDKNILDRLLSDNIYMTSGTRAKGKKL